MRRSPLLSAFVGGLVVTLAVAGAVPALGKPGHKKPPPKHGPAHPPPPPPHKPPTPRPATFSVGQLQTQTASQTGCGTNSAGEPSIHVSKTNLVALGSEDGLGGGSEFWSAHQARGVSSSSGCALTYDGQPNAFGVGASGGDVDVAIAPVKDSTSGTYRIYVASLNIASVNVATSTDDGKTFGQVPVVGGVPADDREWIAAYGASTALLSYHDIATGNIDVLRSDDGGQTFVQTSRVIDDGDYKSGANQHGNLVIDHVNKTGAATGQFWAYQSFVAPSTSSGSKYDEAFLGVSNDGGATWTTKPIPCTTKIGAANGLDHNFPNVSVAPNGTLFYAVSNDKAVYVAMSTNHGTTWTCSGPVSTGTQAVFPWLVATNTGVDLVYYGATGTGARQLWSAYFTQTLTQSLTGWRTSKVVDVHRGPVCESGIGCSDNRQLLDDFGVDVDQSGWAHIAYSHDAPNFGDQGSYTGYAVQTGGSAIGRAELGDYAVRRAGSGMVDSHNAISVRRAARSAHASGSR